MKKTLLFLSFVVFSLQARECPDNISQVNFPITKQFLDAKRTLSFKEKSKHLKFKGDVRCNFGYRRERQKNERLKGGGVKDRANIPIVCDQLSVKSNLKFDYQCQNAYAVCQIEFDNRMGTQALLESCNNSPLLFGTGFCDYLCLKRAYAGYDLIKNESEHLSLEFGRRSLYYIFDSRVQFKARVDGIIAKYSNTFAKYEDKRSSNAYITYSAFLIDIASSHYGHAAETGVYNILNSGLDLKYSLIDWRQHGTNACGQQNPIGWEFLNSQWTADYNFKQRFYGKKLNLYGAFLLNHAAKKISFIIENDEEVPIQNPQKENFAFYCGCILGEVKKSGDFSFEASYQYVSAQATSECDIRGIGRGNLRKESFPVDRRGNTNFKGINLELLYAITDKLNIDIAWKASRAVDKKIGGGNHIYSSFDLEIIHAF